MDARPSDAVILALKSGAPILVEERVIDQRMDLVGEDGGTEAQLMERLQEIRPDDLSGEPT